MQVKASLLLQLCIAIGVAQAGPPFPRGLQEKFQGILDRATKTCNCSMSLAAYHAGETVAAASGTARFHSGSRKTDPADAFPWGSGTKPLTGASILRLVSEGALGLDDRVAPVVDPFIAAMAAKDPSSKFSSMKDLWGYHAASVTVRQLLAMETGIPDFDTADAYTHNFTDVFREDVYAHPDKDYTPLELMSKPWVAGTWKNGYSTTGFMLLGMILSTHFNATSWLDFDQGVYLPKTLKGKVRFGLTKSPAQESCVPGYDRTAYNTYPITNNKNVADVHGVFAGWTGSNMVASPSAVAEMTWSIYGPEPTILPKSYADMMSQFPRKLWGPAWYGLATFPLNSSTCQPAGPYGEAYGHYGNTYGYQSVLLYFPGLEFAMAYSTNAEYTPPSSLGIAPGPSNPLICEAYAYMLEAMKPNSSSSIEAMLV